MFDISYYTEIAFKSKHADYSLPVTFCTKDEVLANFLLSQLITALKKEKKVLHTAHSPLTWTFRESRRLALLAGDLYVFDPSDLFSFSIEYTSLRSNKAYYKKVRFQYRRTRLNSGNKYDVPFRSLSIRMPAVRIIGSEPNKQIFLEHEQTKRIPGTNKFVRTDKGNTNTKTQTHAHIKDRKGNDLFAVNLDGTGHDGSHGILIDNITANYLRSLNFNIKPGNLIESTLADEALSIICENAMLNIYSVMRQL